MTAYVILTCPVVILFLPWLRVLVKNIIFSKTNIIVFFELLVMCTPDHFRFIPSRAGASWNMNFNFVQVM